MRRPAIPHLQAWLALVALVALAVAGCGGSSPGTGATTTNAPTQGATTPGSSTTSTTASGARTARKPSPHAFAAAPITSAGAAQLVKTGRISLPVAVGGPGTVSAFGQAALPGNGVVRVAQGSTVVSGKAGTVNLTLALTPLARAQLAAGRSILMYVGVSFSKGDVVQRLEVLLKP